MGALSTDDMQGEDLANELDDNPHRDRAVNDEYQAERSRRMRSSHSTARARPRDNGASDASAAKNLKKSPFFDAA